MSQIGLTSYKLSFRAKKQRTNLLNNRRELDMILSDLNTPFDNSEQTSE
jgi:hypothetical protein